MNGLDAGIEATGAAAPTRYAQVLRRVRALRARGTATGADLRNARDVVLIASSSRGGSTIFAEMLRRAEGLLHLRGEINPFLVLHGRTTPASGEDGDVLHARHAVDAEALLTDLAYDVGHPSDAPLDDAAIWQFAVDLACRLTLQWPETTFALEDVHASVRAALDTLHVRHGWERGVFGDAALFHAVFLRALAPRHPEIDPHLYDIGPDVLAAVFGPTAGGAGRASLQAAASPLATIVEEPPFVCVRPWRLATDEELRARPLVIKTPSNAYRLPFFLALFPGLRVLHLTRNVAASVNGLVDGWQFHGFWSHRHDGASERPWWKFDLPPGWRDWQGAPLEQVCAFQWRAAHTAALDWLDANPAVPRLRLAFEDLFSGAATRKDAITRLSDWLRVPLDASAVDTLPPMMATARPRQRRWHARAPQLETVLRDPRNLALMERLGYAPDPATWT
jgi:hypothetical protein